MKKDKKIYWIVGIVVVLAIVGIMLFLFRDKIFHKKEVFDNYQYVVVDQDNNVSIKKVKPNFQIEVLPDENFTYEVVDSKGNKVDTSLIKQKDVSLISPKKKYTKGETYTVTIENGSFQNEKLKGVKKFSFKVERDEVEKVVYEDNVKRVNSQNTSFSNQQLHSQENYQVGDIVIIDNQEAYKITKVNGNQSYDVELPAMEELFKEIDIYKEEKVNLSNVEVNEAFKDYLVQGVKQSSWYDNFVETVHAEPKISLDFDTDKAKDGILVVKLNFTIPAGDDNPILDLENHELSFDVQFEIEITSQIDWNWLSADVALNVKITDSYQVNINYIDAKLEDVASIDDIENAINAFATEKLNYDTDEVTQLLGKVEVPIGPTGLACYLDLGLIFDYKLAVDAGYKVKNQTDISFGFNYKVGGNFNVYGYSTTKNLENEAYIGGEASAELGLEAAVGITFLNLADVNITADAGLYGEAEFNLTVDIAEPSESSFTASGDIGIFTNIDLKYKALVWDGSKSLLEYKKSLYKFEIGDQDEPVSGNQEKVSITDADIRRYYQIYSDETTEYYTEVISKNSVTSAQLTDLQKLEIAVRRLKDSDLLKNNANGNEQYSVTVSTLNKYITESFGPGVTFNPDNAKSLSVITIKDVGSSIVTNSAAHLDYNASRKRYDINPGGVGGCIGPECFYRQADLVDAYKEGDYLYLIEKQIYILQKRDQTTMDLISTAIYKDSDKKLLVTNNAQSKDSSYKEYLNQGSQVTIVLKKDTTGNYYFVKSVVDY